MDWILYAPQYHAIVGIIAVACLVVCVKTLITVRRIERKGDRLIVEVKLSYQAVRLLEQVAERGIWGDSIEEVAARLVDEGLQRFVLPPELGIAIQDKRDVS